MGIIVAVTVASMFSLPNKLELKQATKPTPQPSNDTKKETPFPTVTVPPNPYSIPASPTNPPITSPPLTPMPTPVLPPPNYPNPLPMPEQTDTPPEK